MPAAEVVVGLDLPDIFLIDARSRLFNGAIRVTLGKPRLLNRETKKAGIGRVFHDGALGSKGCEQQSESILKYHQD